MSPWEDFCHFMESSSCRSLGLNAAEKGPHSFCHSERSEESLLIFMGLKRREIPRFARNDKINYFFHSLFSLKSIPPCAVRSVEMFGQPVLASLGEEIVEMPDRRKRIDATMVPRRARQFSCVGKIDFAVVGAAEYADGGPLSFFVFHKKIAVKRVVVAGEETNLVPAPAAAPIPEAADLHFGNQDEIDFVAHVLGDARIAVSPHVAHRARKLVVRTPHHVIHDQAVLAGSEEFREANVADICGRFVPN